MTYGGIQQGIQGLGGNISVEAFRQAAKDQKLQKAAEQQEAASDLKASLS